MAKGVTKVKYLIIGNSAGGIGAAEAIRAVDKGSVAIVSDEPYPAYSRPLIAEYLKSQCPLEKMLYRPADFYEKNGIRTYLGQKARRLDVEKRIVELESGERLSWDKLLVATGGEPIVPAMEGVGRRGVFTFTTLDDAKKIDQFLGRVPVRGARAVVIGGGLIGMSVSEALVKRGVKVTIVEMRERILSLMLDEEGSVMEEAALRQAGVDVVAGRTVAEIVSYSGDTVTSVALDDGTPVPCDLVVVAIGVRPRTGLVSGTPVRTNRGIAVDRHMATSVPGVYACGDAAEAYDFVYGEPRLTPIWPNACVGGRVAGFNMAGITTEYPGSTAMNSLKYFGLEVVSAGLVNRPDDSYEVVSRKHNGTYHKVVLKDGHIVGMVFVGNIEKSGIVFGLMKDRVDVRAFKQVLVAPDFGLSALPEEIWRQRIGVPLADESETAKRPAEMVAGGAKSQ